MWTCNRPDLQTLGSQPVIMPKNLPDHWSKSDVFSKSKPRNGESTQPLVTDEPVEFEKPVEVTSRLQEKLPIILEEPKEYTPIW